MRVLEEPLTQGIDAAALLEALTALKKGDFSVRLPVEWTGIAGKVADTLNDVLDLNERMAKELERLNQVVGREGRINQRASLGAVNGSWAASIQSVNQLIDDLVQPTRETARVIGAVAQGDLSQTMALEIDDRPLQGEFLRMATIVNKMVVQLGSFAAEVTRVAREVGTEGNLGGQAKVEGVSGTWKDLTDNVNSMAGNLTSQVRNIAAVTTAVANGDLSKKITVDVKGEILELKNTVNTMVDQLGSFASEVTRVAREVGTEGKLGGQAQVKGVSGTWKDLTDNVNFMAGNLTSQVRNIAEVTTAVATGDLSKKITVDVKGEILELKNTINTMVDQLSSFAAEVTRVAREVGTEGKLGGQAHVKGVSGTWKDLTDNVNFMAGNLTSQVRGIAKVVTAVANGDLKRKLTVEAKGEIAALAGTINGMIDTLATFAEQVTSVAREVGVEGKLGGQASVPGAAGTWKDLTDNVNQLAANLTTQVRAIAKVATAVAKGDLTRSIKVKALGEVAALKDNINEMIRNLKDTTLKNSEQDWLKTNLAKFSRMLQGQKDLVTVGRLILSELAPVVSAQHGVFYILDSSGDVPELNLLAGYAHGGRGATGKRLALGEGLVGQCALTKQKTLLANVPADYVRIASGLGDASARSIIVLPVIFEGQVKGVLELASFERFTTMHQTFLDQLTESIGIVLNTIEANMRTEELLKQSQSLAGELQSRQLELQDTNQELQEKAGLLARQKLEVERNNQEVEQARQALEEKANQLALTSRFKSEFLANMSHELRTPLNSLLILSDQLCKNPEGNLSAKQTEFAKTIHGSGTDLLTLINDILDLAKIESGTVVLDLSELRLADLQGFVDRTFRHVAEAKGVDFTIELRPGLPATLLTDAKRLRQVLKNLLSNAFKFTQQGKVAFMIEPAVQGWNPENGMLGRAQSVVAFCVSDTGIGISADKQPIIFEAFQQADGSTSRKYGGTGLGLAISREISRLLGGEIRVVSAAGRGSTFILYLPRTYTPCESGASFELPPTAALGSNGGVSHWEGQAPADQERQAQHEPRPPKSTRYGSKVEPLRTEAEVAPLFNEFADDRDSLGEGDHVLLIVENDALFAKVILDVARERGFKGLVTTLGAAALALTRDYRPDAITLDICLPDIDGWRVLERLKNDFRRRHIPVCLISTEEVREKSLKLGAHRILGKPIGTKDVLERALDTLKDLAARPKKNLLLAVKDATRRARLKEFIGTEAIQVDAVGSSEEAAKLLQDRRFDCLVFEPALPDFPSYFAEELARAPELADLPIIAFTEGELGWDEEAALNELTPLTFVRRVHSLERLLDQTTLCMHCSVAGLPEARRHMLETLHQTDKVLAGKKVLIVDDDIRNIFALTSLLEWHNIVPFPAETGREAIRILQREPQMDIVLMDIMMPEIDGFETLRVIRQLPGCKTLPIIAVTAKAMKGDREKCIAAGAWDYLSKPVDSEQLLAVLRGWLHR